MSEAETEDSWPNRRINDPSALRALAHPLRLRLLELLALHGPATATELAERVKQSPANCSWHLRQLAGGGFIEEALGGKGRQRRWRFIPTGHSYRDGGDDPELTEAQEMAEAMLLEHELAEFRAWRAQRARESLQWRDAAFTKQMILWLTAEELDELGDDLKQLFLRHTQRLMAPETRPENSRPVRLFGWGFPVVADTDD